MPGCSLPLSSYSLTVRQKNEQIKQIENGPALRRVDVFKALLPKNGHCFKSSIQGVAPDVSILEVRVNKRLFFLKSQETSVTGPENFVSKRNN